MKTKNKPKRKSEDYIYHFELESLDEENTVYDNPLVEMIREQIINLSEIIELTKEEEGVSIDGFRFLCDKNTIYRLFPQEGQQRESAS